MSRLSSVRKLRECSWSERFILMEGFVLLGVARAGILVFSFSRLAVWLGLVQGGPDQEMNGDQAMTASSVGWAVRTASFRTPWDSTCLVQTLAAAAMLRRRRIPCTLFLGVARDAQDIVAHAWLGCGGDILTGSGVHRRFAQISSFSLTCTEPPVGQARI